jgi:hypothetical protein
LKKLNSLKDLFSILDNSSTPELLHHFLFFLGTDTEFTPIPTTFGTNYDRGETLSYSAQAIVSWIGETETAESGEKGDPLSYCSPSVDVLDGPTTLGTEVGDRVAQGVFLALRAAATGKKSLQISAHSRGAVEAILVMHELGRIKEELTASPEKTLHQILLDSPSKSTTGAAMKKLFPQPDQPDQNDNEDNRKKLLQCLNELEINSFLIDPVPGDTVFFIPGITWHDRLFYEQPPCKNYELLLYRDERSGCFYPIVPKGMQATIIPGHHGTGSGNHYSQQLAELPDSLKGFNTLGVQNLVLCKLFHFLHKVTNIFERNIGSERITLDLHHSDLDKILNEYLNVDVPAREKLLIKHYMDVHKNDQAYRHFTSTTYKDYFLGKALAPDNQRYIHYNRSDYASMAILSPEMYDGFVNIEHAMLHLNDGFDFSKVQTYSANEQVKAIDETLKKIIDDIVKVSTDSEDQSKLLLILESNGPGRRNFLKGLSIIVDSISQKYLRNNLSVDEKAHLLSIIKHPFTTLSNATATANDKPLISDNPDHLQLMIECQEILQAGLKRTIEAHFRSICDQSNQIHEEITLYLSTQDDFNTKWTSFINSLTNNTDNQDITDYLKSIKQQLSQVNPTNTDSFTKALGEEINKIQKNRQLQEATKIKLMSFFTSKEAKQIQAHLETLEHDVDSYLSKIQYLYDAATSLLHAHQELTTLVGEQGLDIRPTELLIRSIALPTLAGSMLKGKNYDLHNSPKDVSEEFYNLAKNQAIALGAPSPEMAYLEKMTEKQKEKIIEMSKDKDRYTLDAHEKDKKIAAMEQKTDDLSNEIAEKNQLVVKQEQTINELTQQGEINLAEIKSLQQKHVAELSQKEIQLVAAKDTQIEQIQSLQQQLTRLTQEKEALSSNHSAEIEAIRQQHGAELSQKEIQLVAAKDTQIEQIQQQSNVQKNQLNQLNTEKEATCFLLIHQKLSPLSTKYLHYLLIQAKKYIPELDKNDYNQMLPASDGLDDDIERKEAYDKIKAKYDAVQGLYLQLTTTDVALPSQRLTNFGNALQGCATDLKLHRDPFWKAYFKSCIAVIAIIATGIIPGILCLAAYSNISGRSPLFFSQSNGEQYVEDIVNANEMHREAGVAGNR